MDAEIAGNVDGAGPPGGNGAQPPDIEIGEEQNNAPGSWRDELPEEYRRGAEKFLSPADVVKSYAELERKLGKSIAIPDEHSSEEDVREFFRQVGRPDSPDGYEYQLPDDLPDVLLPDADAKARTARFLDLAHAQGLGSDQVQALINWYYGESKDFVAGASDSNDETNARLGAELRQEWGKDYDSNLEFGRRAMELFGDNDSLGRLKDIIGQPSVLRMMARIGRHMGEAGDISGGIGDHRRKSLDDELNTLMKKKDYWQNETVQKRVREINVELYGTGPVVGGGNRTV